MNAPGRYPIPAGPCRDEQIIRRSRFVASLSPASDLAAARAFIDDVRAAHADATHNAWAHLIGPPGSTASAGMSDDGEVRGTAGRPMLELLTHSGLGDVVVVVSRWYGGTKLGKGGLVRAYSTSVQRVLEKVARVEKVALTPLVLSLTYAHLDRCERILAAQEARVREREYADAVRLTVDVAVDRRASLLAELAANLGPHLVRVLEKSQTIPDN